MTAAVEDFVHAGYDLAAEATMGALSDAGVTMGDIGVIAAGNLMGETRIRTLYAHAIREGYRFFSYGDSSLLIPDQT